MKNIIYRKINKKDYNFIKEMMNENFYLYEYIEDKNVLESFLNVYLYSCLAEKTFSAVAELDGKTVGVILGNVKKRHNLFKSFIYNLKSSYYMLITGFRAIKYKSNIKKYKGITKIYKNLMKEVNKDFEGILTLFVVDKQFQGYGIGKNLLSKFLYYAKENKIKNLYLYTDSKCNYKFYDKNGFVKINEDIFNVVNKNNKFDLEIFLYEYNFY